METATAGQDVVSAEADGKTTLTLRHTQQNDRPLHDNAQEVLRHVGRL